jgi:hypothetical protein
LLQQTGGAEAGEGAAGQRRAALWASVGLGHRRKFRRVHTLFRSKTGKTLPDFWAQAFSLRSIPPLAATTCG